MPRTLQRGAQTSCSWRRCTWPSRTSEETTLVRLPPAVGCNQFGSASGGRQLCCLPSTNQKAPAWC